MLNNEKKQILDQILGNFSREEIAWSSGFLAGSLTGSNAGNTVASATPALVKELTIIYVTETGNSKFLAGEIAKKFKAAGTPAKLKAAEQYRLKDLTKEKNLIVVASTHGEGEIPETGKKLLDHISQDDLKLDSLNFLVVALGDTNYPLFCQSGKDIEEKLEKLGAKKSGPRIDLDLDFEDSMTQILDQSCAAFTTDKSAVSNVATAPVKSGKKNFTGEIVANVNLNDVGSDKETYHLEIESEDELNYEPGDSVGIILNNEQLEVEGAITPRLYSIASSVNEHGNEVHLTVALLRYIDKDGKEVKGLFSNYLSNLKEGDKVEFYISKNRQFKLPQDDKNIIMVGPGTGVAPFRSFIAERNYRSAAGKNWLFFGERTFQNDFLYQAEWLDHLNSGLLSKIDVAFSRDQDHKIYVQDRIRENAKDVYAWLEDGAYFYICGDKDKMALDVENCLLEVIESQGNLNKDEAKNYLDKLVEQGRYLKDVY